MPLENLGNGKWRWGKSGKIYSGSGAKQKAEKQMRAIFASGYNEMIKSINNFLDTIGGANNSMKNEYLEKTLKDKIDKVLTKTKNTSWEKYKPKKFGTAEGKLGLGRHYTPKSPLTGKLPKPLSSTKGFKKAADLEKLDKSLGETRRQKEAYLGRSSEKYKPMTRREFDAPSVPDPWFAKKPKKIKIPKTPKLPPLPKGFKKSKELIEKEQTILSKCNKLINTLKDEPEVNEEEMIDKAVVKELPDGVAEIPENSETTTSEISNEEIKDFGGESSINKPDKPHVKDLKPSEKNVSS